MSVASLVSMLLEKTTFSEDICHGFNNTNVNNKTQKNSNGIFIVNFEKISRLHHFEQISHLQLWHRT